MNQTFLWKLKILERWNEYNLQKNRVSYENYQNEKKLNKGKWSYDAGWVYVLFIYTVRSTYCKHVFDIEKTFPIYFVLSLFKQKLGSISSPQQFIFSSRYWHLTNLWNMDVFPGVWCVKMFLCQVSEGVNKLIKFSTHNAQWELTLTLYFDSWEKGRDSISFLPMLLDI